MPCPVSDLRRIRLLRLRRLLTPAAQLVARIGVCDGLRPTQRIASNAAIDEKRGLLVDTTVGPPMTD